MTTVKKRSEGVWEVRVFLGRDENGKPIQRSKTVRGGKRDADRVAAELETKPSRAARTTVADTLESSYENCLFASSVSSACDLGERIW